MFRGLRSRWATPSACRWARPHAMPCITTIASANESPTGCR
jgi:hypothetical protein